MIDIKLMKKYTQDLNILYIEDDLELRKSTSDILGNFFIEIDTADNGESGLAKYIQYQLEHGKYYDLIITDINMPKMNGIDMCEKILEINDEQFIVITTAYNDVDFLSTALDLGIDGYITKPIQNEKLIHVLYKVAHAISNNSFVKSHIENLKTSNVQLTSELEETLENLKKENKSLEQYKKVIDHSTIVSKADLRGIITYVNEAFCEISGYTAEELIGKNHNTVRSPHMPKEAFKDLWDTIQNKKTWRGVVENRAKNGESYFVQATMIPILDENHEIIEYVGIRQDITELKMLQINEINKNVDQALDVRLQDIVDFVPVCAAIVDEDSNILFTNEIFNNTLSFLNEEKTAIDALFIEKEGFVSSSSIIDFKDEVISFQNDENLKVLMHSFVGECEFNISIKKIETDENYLILLFEIDNDIVG